MIKCQRRSYKGYARVVCKKERSNQVDQGRLHGGGSIGVGERNSFFCCAGVLWGQEGQMKAQFGFIKGRYYGKSISFPLGLVWRSREDHLLTLRSIFFLFKQVRGGAEGEKLKQAPC